VCVKSVVVMIMYVCKCDKGVWANLTPLEQKYSCERSE
jgi:hypothetical protein